MLLVICNYNDLIARLGCCKWLLILYHHGGQKTWIFQFETVEHGVEKSMKINLLCGKYFIK